MEGKDLTYKLYLKQFNLQGCLQEENKEVVIMKKSGFSFSKIAALVTMLGLLLSGCASQTGMTSKQYDENWRFVPRVHVEDNSFGVTSGSEYWGCSYDIQYEGYWCPTNR